MGMIFMPMEHLNENVYKTPATQYYPNEQYVTYYSYQTIVNPSALKKT
jgi:hypothetical protein